MAAKLVTFPVRADSRVTSLFGDVIGWDDWIYDATTVVEFTPHSLTTEALSYGPASAQEWWEALAARWPGAALDVIGRLRAAGHGSEDIRVDHSLAMFGDVSKSSRGKMSPVGVTMHRQPKEAASSRAFMALVAKLDPEVLGDLVDQLVDFLGASHNIANP